MHVYWWVIFIYHIKICSFFFFVKLYFSYAPLLWLYVSEAMFTWFIIGCRSLTYTRIHHRELHILFFYSQKFHFPWFFKSFVTCFFLFLCYLLCYCQWDENANNKLIEINFDRTDGENIIWILFGEFSYSSMRPFIPFAFVPPPFHVNYKSVRIQIWAGKNKWRRIILGDFISMCPYLTANVLCVFFFSHTRSYIYIFASMIIFCFVYFPFN